MNKLFIFLIALSLLIVSSCKKDENEAPEIDAILKVELQYDNTSNFTPLITATMWSENDAKLIGVDGLSVNVGGTYTYTYTQKIETSEMISVKSDKEASRIAISGGFLPKDPSQNIDEGSTTLDLVIKIYADEKLVANERVETNKQFLVEYKLR